MQSINEKGLLDRISRFKRLIEENRAKGYTINYALQYIDQFGVLDIPPQVIIEHKLVKYMKDLCKYEKLKRNAGTVAKNWQGKVQEWLKANNLTEKQYLQHNSTTTPPVHITTRVISQLDRNEESILTASPQLNGALKVNQNSGSDDRHNYPSSSSQEVESPDSQRASQRSIDHQSNHQPFLDRDLSRESSSPPQLEAQNHNSDEFNDNLSIDPQEVTPVNKVQASPSFSVSLKENMCKAVKIKKPIEGQNMILFQNACQSINIPQKHYPEYLKNFIHVRGYRNSGDCTRSINGETEKNKDSTHMPSTLHNSHNMLSPSQQRIWEALCCPEFKPEERLKKVKDAVKYDSKRLKCEKPPFHNFFPTNLPSTSQAAEETSRNCGFNDDRRRKRMESTHSFMNSREVKLEQQSTQDSKTSLSKLGGMESSRTCLDRKRKHAESSQSVIKADELKEKQRFSLNGRSKHWLQTEFVTKDEETAQWAAKAYEFGRKKLDPRQICLMDLKGRNCDKNHVNKRDSHEQRPLSIEEQNPKYYRNFDLYRLRDRCMRTLIKAINQNPNPLKFIFRPLDFKVLEVVLLQINADKLQIIEDHYKYLQSNTDEIWKFFCKNKFIGQIHLKKEQENWRTFYWRCHAESEEKLQEVTKSINTSKAKPERQIKLTTVNGPPAKRPKADNAMVARNHANNAAVRPLPSPCQPSISRPEGPVPPKGFSSHMKSSGKTIKKDAPLMHKAKKTLVQLNRIHRN